MNSEWNRDACNQWGEEDGPSPEEIEKAEDDQRAAYAAEDRMAEEWHAWCEAQDAANHAGYFPTPQEMGRCYSGAHDVDAGCKCDPYWTDDSIPF